MPIIWRGVPSGLWAITGGVSIAIRRWSRVDTPSIAPNTRDVSALNDLGNLMVEMGQPKRALEYFQRALEGGGDRSEIRPNLAVALASAGRAADAELELRQAVEEDPENGAARSMLVAMLDEQNRVDEAEAVLLDTPGGLVDTDQLLLAGNLQLRKIGHPAFPTGRHPGHPLALNNLGLVRVFRADPVEAEKCFRSALSAERRYAEPWRNIVALKHYGDCGDDDIESMKRLDRDSSLTDSSRIHLGFALGKSLDDCGRYDEAFAHYDRANTLRRAQTPFDADALDSHAERIRSVFDRQFLAERRRWGSDSAMPVYIVGMPRTGTTLLEQILSAHPAFFGAGELLLVNQVIARLEKASTGGAVEAYPECCASLTPEAVARVSGDYLGVLESLTNDPAVERVSDKMPYNFFHLGFVGLLFPGARIIHSTRNILDTCLSAYFNYFPRGLDFTYSFDDLVAFCRIYREMIAHWRDRVGLDILDVSYEALVAVERSPGGEMAPVREPYPAPDRRSARNRGRCLRRGIRSLIPAVTPVIWIKTAVEFPGAGCRLSTKGRR